MLKKYFRILTKSFTFTRFLNLIKISTAYIFSLILRKPVVWGYPPIIMIEPTNYCNLKCPLCPSGADQLSRERGYMSYDLFKKIVDDVAQHSFMLILWNQGEPFLNPDFCKMMEYANAKKMFLMVSTNANVMPEAKNIIDSGVDRVIISLDGATQDTYNKYRVNGSLQKVLDNVKKLIDEKKKKQTKVPHIIWQFLVMKHNEHEIEQIKQLAKDLQVDECSLKTVQIYTKDDIDFLPENPKYRRYKLNGNNFEIKYKLKNRCYRIWNQPVINWNGEVAVCCFDKDNMFKIGNVKNESFIKIWNSDNFMNFRKAILKNRSKFEICRNCGEGVSLKINNEKV